MVKPQDVYKRQMYNAALPAMAISRPGGGETALGWVNACTGVATLLGGVFTSLRGAPRSRVRVIHDSLLFAPGQIKVNVIRESRAVEYAK